MSYINFEETRKKEGKMTFSELLDALKNNTVWYTNYKGGLLLNNKEVEMVVNELNATVETKDYLRGLIVFRFDAEKSE